MKRSIEPYVFNNIRLRLITENDLPLTLAWRNLENNRKWFKNSHLISSEEHFSWYKAYTEKDDDFVFIVETSGIPNRSVGQASIYKIDWKNRTAEIGRFVVSPKWAGRGLMKKASQAIVLLAFSVFGLKSLHLEVFDKNARAKHIYEECGFKTIQHDSLSGTLTMKCLRENIAF